MRVVLRERNGEAGSLQLGEATRGGVTVAAIMGHPVPTNSLKPCAVRILFFYIAPHPIHCEDGIWNSTRTRPVLVRTGLFQEVTVGAIAISRTAIGHSALAS
jgi:hypothetical protein